MKKVMFVLLFVVQPLVAMPPHRVAPYADISRKSSLDTTSTHDKQAKASDEGFMDLCDRPRGCWDRPVKAILLAVFLSTMLVMASTQDVQQEG